MLELTPDLAHDLYLDLLAELSQTRRQPGGVTDTDEEAVLDGLKGFVGRAAWRQVAERYRRTGDLARFNLFANWSNQANRLYEVNQRLVYEWLQKNIQDT